jgi:hypothetical protein
VSDDTKRVLELVLFGAAAVLLAAAVPVPEARARLMYLGLALVAAGLFVEEL